uniref:Uncharacterized protein n=1 Tax=Rhizophagus irregularis (strain DAOM 181602 / DAOM 197198 / MUCL 43194) TaxID=747089 RepID=U9TMS0_RHIID
MRFRRRSMTRSEVSSRKKLLRVRFERKLKVAGSSIICFFISNDKLERVVDIQINLFNVIYRKINYETAPGHVDHVVAKFQIRHDLKVSTFFIYHIIAQSGHCFNRYLRYSETVHLAISGVTA